MELSKCLQSSKLVPLLVIVFFLVFGKGNGMSVCPTRSISSQEGEITSPNYPDDYPSNTDCTLTITTKPGTKLNIVFNQMSIEQDEDAAAACKVDRLIVTDGPKTRRYCKEGVQADELAKMRFKTVGNIIAFTFKSDGELEFEGFKLTYSAEKPRIIPKEFKICPSRHIKRRMSGEYFSPNYPLEYPPNQRCRIRMHIPDNYQMNVWLSHFDLQDSPVCRSDKLIVKDDLGGLALCGGGVQHKLRALTATTAKIQFYSDRSVGKTGFHLHYNMTMLKKGNCLCSSGNSFIMITDFNKKINRNLHTIEFSIKTTQANGLILFSKGTYRDYIYIGIENGKVFYGSDLGTGRNKAIVRGISVNDNRWHNVVILRRKKTLMIDIDTGAAIATAKTKGGFNKIDLPNSVGLALGAPSFMGLTKNFIGCIRDFKADTIYPLTNAYAGKPAYKFFGTIMNECRELSNE